MSPDDEATLDDLLSRWHSWQHAAKVGRGHADRSLVCGDRYRPSRQYDDENGALDDALDARRSQAVEVAVRALDEPYRPAIYCNARDIATGRRFECLHPSMPSDPLERFQITGIARVLLVKRLASAGVM